MQRFAFRCGTIAASFAALAQAQAGQTRCLDDSTQLFQNLALVSESPQEQKPVTKKVLDTVQKELQPSSTFMNVIKDMQRKWKEHKVRQLEETQPWKAKEERIARAEKKKHRGDRSKPSAPAPKPKTVKELSEEEKKALEQEARIAKFGETMSIIVREPSGREFVVKFRSNTRLQVLMHSICKKLGVEVEGTSFQHRDLKLDPLATPMSFGLVDQDVIEVDSEELQAQAEAMANRVEKGGKDVAAKLMEKETQKNAQEATEMKRQEKRLRVARKRVVVEAQEKRKHELALNDMVTLNFERVSGGAPTEHVSLGVKRNNWLQGTMALVCKRMNLDPTTTRFYYGKGGKRVLLRDTDSVRVLGLTDMEAITVAATGQ